MTYNGSPIVGFDFNDVASLEDLQLAIEVTTSLHLKHGSFSYIKMLSVHTSFSINFKGVS